MASVAGSRERMQRGVNNLTVALVPSPESNDASAGIVYNHIHKHIAL